MKIYELFGYIHDTCKRHREHVDHYVTKSPRPTLYCDMLRMLLHFGLFDGKDNARELYTSPIDWYNILIDDFPASPSKVKEFHNLLNLIGNQIV